MDAVEALKGLKIGAGLVQGGDGAGKDDLLGRAGLGGQHRHGADGLEHQVHDAGGQVRVAGVLRHVAEVGGGEVGGEDFRAVAGDVPHHEVHVLEVAVRRQALDLAKALHVHQPPAEAAQGAAADAAAADVLHRVLIDVEEGGAGAHGDHQRRLPPGQGQRALAHGVELVHLGGGDAVNVPVHKGGALAGETDAVDIVQGELVAGNEAAHGSKEGGELVLALGAEHPQGGAVLPEAHHLGGGAANVDAENDTHV